MAGRRAATAVGRARHEGRPRRGRGQGGGQGQGGGPRPGGRRAARGDTGAGGAAWPLAPLPREGHMPSAPAA
eukprot:3809-Prymnesium_polylepis.1